MLRRILKALQTDLAAIGRVDETNPDGAERLGATFLQWLERCSAIDAPLLDLVRALPEDPQKRARALGYVVPGVLVASDSSPAQFSAQMHEEGLLRGLIRSLPEPDLIIDVSEEFRTIRLSHGQRTIDIHAPLLLWDCHCKTPGPTTRSPTECPIHRHPDGDEFASRFYNGHVLIRYRGLSFRWRQGPTLWPPSFDSFVMVEDLEKDKVFEREHRSVLDLGCGTGFLGILCAYFNRHVLQLDVGDWLYTPILFSLVNWHLNCQKRAYVTVRGHAGLFADWRISGAAPFDLVLCNPPYLPLLNEYTSLAAECTVAGTDLLAYVIREARSLGRHAYVQFSDLAADAAREAAGAACVRLVPIGPEREVPFRIAYLWKHPDYLKALVTKFGLVERTDHRHRFWHRIRTYRVAW